MKKRLVALLVVMASLAAFAIGVFAADNVKEISATINYALKMKVDNIDWNPTEDDGTAIRPITYNGRTYLPVRAIAEKFGIAIDWDGETQTVIIGDREWTPLNAKMVKSNNASFTEDPDALYNGSGVYDYGLSVDKEWIGNQFSDADILTNGKFGTMKFNAVAMGGDATIEIRDKETDQSYKTVTLKANTPVDVEFKINASQALKIKWGANEKVVTSIVLGNVTFK